jgi:hypothetical protein
MQNRKYPWAVVFPLMRNAVACLRVFRSPRRRPLSQEYEAGYVFKTAAVNWPIVRRDSFTLRVILKAVKNQQPLEGQKPPVHSSTKFIYLRKLSVVLHIILASDSCRPLRLRSSFPGVSIMLVIFGGGQNGRGTGPSQGLYLHSPTLKGVDTHPCPLWDSNDPSLNTVHIAHPVRITFYWPTLIHHPMYN